MHFISRQSSCKEPCRTPRQSNTKSYGNKSTLPKYRAQFTKASTSRKQSERKSHCSGQSCPGCSPESRQMLSVFTTKLQITGAVHNGKASNRSRLDHLKAPGGCFCSFRLHSINSKQAGITCWLRSGRRATSIQRAADSKCITPVSVSLFNIYCRWRLE